ncbi:MAG: Rieske (2Fe-2S) protein [Pseudomonadota bacterium]
MPRAHDVCAAGDVSVGALHPVKVGRSTVVLTRLPDDSLKAFSGRCPHMGARLEFGCITGYADGTRREEIVVERPGEILRCPWHGFEFDLVTGEPAVAEPDAMAMRLRFYDVAEEDGRVIVFR